MAACYELLSDKALELIQGLLGDSLVDDSGRWHGHLASLRITKWIF